MYNIILQVWTSLSAFNNAHTNASSPNPAAPTSTAYQTTHSAEDNCKDCQDSIKFNSDTGGSGNNGEISSKAIHSEAYTQLAGSFISERKVRFNSYVSRSQCMTENQIAFDRVLELPLSLSPTHSFESNESNESMVLQSKHAHPYNHSKGSKHSFRKVHNTPTFHFCSDDEDPCDRMPPLRIDPQLFKWKWSLESLPPMRLSPSSDGESGPQDPIVFAPPTGTRIMSESDLLPYEPIKTEPVFTSTVSCIRRNKSCLDLPSTSHHLRSRGQTLRPIIDSTVVIRGRTNETKPLGMTREARVHKRRGSVRDGGYKACFLVGGESESDDE